MARVVLSNHSHQPIVELKQAANVKWHNQLNSIGYTEFDLALSDTYASPTYLNPGNYVHVYSDSADSTIFTNADFGGQLANDFEVKPNEGVVTVRAAGLANLLNVSIISQTTVYQNMTVASIVSDIINNRNDNAASLGLTTYTNAGSQVVTLYQVNFGENAFNNIETLVTTFNCDFEVRPNWSWASYDRQGVNNPNLVARYGNQGNVQVQATMHILNSQLFNKVYVGSDSTPTIVSVTGQTSIGWYGPFSEFVSANTTAIPTNQDELTMANVELTRHEYPPVMLDNVVLIDSPLMPFGSFHLGDKILFEAPQSASTYTTIIPLSTSVTPLSLYLTSQSAPDQVTANQLTNTTTFATVNMSTIVGFGTGFGEVHAQGTNAGWSAFAQPGSPTGFGWLFDTTILNNTQLQKGNWNQQISLQCGDGLGVIGDVVARWFVYHSQNNTYTPIGTTTLSQQSIGPTATQFSLPVVAATPINLVTGDMLYQDCWVNVTTNSTNTSTGCINWVGVNNLLTLQQSDVEGTDLSGFKRGGTTTLSRDTTTSWHGNSSLKVTTTGVSNTFESVSTATPANVFTPNGTYTFSAFMKSSTGTPTLRFYCQANDLISGNASIGTVGNITLTTSWRQYSFTVGMPSVMSNGGVAFQYLGMRADTGGTPQQVTYWMDGMQITQGGTLAPWVPGGSTNTLGLTTPGYIPTFTQQQTLGALPMLGLFNGLQRILMMEYDDRNRTITVTLGNAIYKIIRGKLSEVRLYT